MRTNSLLCSLFLCLIVAHSICSVEYVVKEKRSFDSKDLGSVSKAFYFSGGLPVCSNCGDASEYACSTIPNHPYIGLFNPNRSFENPVPEGNFVVGARVEMMGVYSCTADGSQSMQISFLLAGTTIDTVTVSGDTNCACNTCNGPRTVEFMLPVGTWPSYKYGTSNNTIDLIIFNNQLCLQYYNVTLFYAPQPSGFKTMYIAPHIQSNYISTTNQVCGWNGFRSCVTSWYADFSDPVGLDQNAFVIGVYNKILGNFYCSYRENTLSATMHNINIGSLVQNTTASTYCSSSGHSCQGPNVVLYNKKTYQAGFPGYNYGSTNRVSFSARHCVYPSSSVETFLIVYTGNSEHH